MYVVDEQADWDSKRTFASVSASVSVLRSFAFLISLMLTMNQGAGSHTPISLANY